jgi:hypothetical protein
MAVGACERRLQAVRSARSEVRGRAWSLAGKNAPDTDGQVTVDLDGVLVIAHSDKEDAAATWKKTYGHHPLTAFVDHGPGGTGEPVAALLRPGNAGSNTAADHIATAQLALAQLPKKCRRGRQTPIRTDSADGTHDFVSTVTLNPIEDAGCSSRRTHSTPRRGCSGGKKSQPSLPRSGLLQYRVNQLRGTT